MSTSLMNHTQGIRGFLHVSFNYCNDRVIQRIRRKQFRCPQCGSSDVTTEFMRDRQIQGLPYGSKKFFVELPVHRIYCRKCKAREVEKLPFLNHKKARITKALTRTLIELRECMSISDASKHYGVDWKTIKDCEKQHLKKKYAKVSLNEVSAIGIDEIHVHRKRNEDKGQEKYVTVVRDLKCGAVLHVGKGKGVDSLVSFTRKLERAKCTIEVVAMDMSNSYSSWAKDALPNAIIVYDHFHVIKLMNEKVDAVRRRICNELNEKDKADLKGKRYLFLYGRENLNQEKAEMLDSLMETYKDLGVVTALKEELRNIYYNAKDGFEAEEMLLAWIAMAQAAGIKELTAMAKTIAKHFDGILAYWNCNKISNAKMEGFNNKIRWLIRQAYGYHDEEYFHLKIFDLPNISTTKKL